MYKSIFRHIANALALLPMLFAAASCVNKEYVIDEDKINLEVNIFQEGVVIPVGTTDVIKVKDLVSMLDEEYQQYLKAREDGVYSIYYADSYDFSDSLSVLKEMVRMDDIDLSRDFTFTLSDVDVSDVKIDAVNEVFEERLTEAFEVPKLSKGVIDGNYSYGAEVYKYAIDPEVLKVDVETVHHKETLVSIPEDFVIPEAYRNDNEIIIDPSIDIPDLPITIAESFGPKSYDLEFEMTMPEGVRAIEEVVMKEDARVRITLEMTQSLLTSGTVNPYVNLDVSDIFHLTDQSSSQQVGIDHILADFAMPATGGAITREYGIKSVVLNDDDWRYDGDGRLVLDKKINLTVLGTPVYNNVKTTTNHIANCGYTETFFELYVEFIDFEIDYVKAVIDPVTVERSEVVKFDLDPIDLPDGVSRVDYIELTDDSVIEFTIATENVERFEGLELTLETLEVTFPEGVEVDGAAGGKLVYTDVDLSEGFTDQIKIGRITLPDPVNGQITIDETIEVKAKAVVQGTINTDDITVDVEDDAKLTVKATGMLEVADYAAVIEGYEYPVTITRTIKEEVPEALLETGEVVVYPAGNPVVAIDVTMPETVLPLGPVKDGITIYIPELLRLKDVPSEYGYDASSNTLTFVDNIPSHIELPIDRLVINPVQDGDKCYAMGVIRVDGTVGVGACTVHKKDIEDLAAADPRFVVKVHIPELVPSSFSLNQYICNITEEVEVEIFQPGQLPDEIISIGRVELGDAYAEISLDASSLPDIGNATLELDFKVDLPDLIVLGEGVRDESGMIHIQGSLDKDKKIVLDPIKIDALDLTGVDLKADEAIMEKVVVDGVVTLADLEVDPDEWMDKKHTVRFDAAIRNITVSKVTGKVDYHIDPIDFSLDVTELKSTINSDNFQTTVDLAHVHLAIDLETNLAIPAMAEAEFIPYYDGQASEAIKVKLEAVKAASVDQPRKTRYWLGANRDCCPEGYTFQEIPILDLIRNLPDSIKMSVNAGTDPEQECELIPEADYILKADYALDIPLLIGEEFKFEFRDTLSGIDPIVSTIFQTGNLVLTGEIESSLPFELDLKARLLDVEGRVIDLEEGSGEQIIKGGNLDGSAVKTELYLKMAKKKGADLPEIDAVELNFKARSVGHGAPITEETYVKAVLQALVPEGVTVDIRDFIPNDEEDE